MATALFDLSISVGGGNNKFAGNADESGGMSDVGTTNIGYPCSITSGGSGVTTVFIMDVVDDELNFTAGDEVVFFYGTSYASNVVGNVDSVDGGANTVTVSFDIANSPVDSTPGLLVKSTVVEFDFTGGNMACMAALVSIDNGLFSLFQTNYAGHIATYQLASANAPWFWLENIEFTNPFSVSAPTFVTFATPSATLTGTYKIAGVLDNTDLQ